MYLFDLITRNMYQDFNDKLDSLIEAMWGMLAIISSHDGLSSIRHAAII